MRLTVLVAFLAGCQIVFPLEPPDAQPEPEPEPCAEAIGHDEDQDGIDDACDRCPTDKVGEADTDTDDDGVGDACDPQPLAPCERRELFEGFASQPVILTPTGGWVHEDDDMVQPNVGQGPATLQIPSRMFSDSRFRASVTLTTLDPGAASNAFALISGSQGPMTTTGYACEIVQEAGTARVQIRNLADDTTEPGTFSGSVIDNTLTFELVNRRTGVTCAILGNPGGGQSDQQGGVDMSSGEVVIASDDLASRVQWIEVIENVCP